MICVEVLSNNKLTVRNDTLATAVSDSIKHETVKFSFADNWNNYRKTAVFSADGVDAINVPLDRENMMCITEDECYIPHEVLKGSGFYLSVYGVDGERLATTTKIKIEVLESGYALGDQPEEPTPSQYSQMLDMAMQTKEIAQSVRDDADNGLFKGEKGDAGPQGEKGEKGDKGDKGDPYTLTDEDKNEIASKVKENMGGGTLSEEEKAEILAEIEDLKTNYATKQYLDDEIDTIRHEVATQEYVDNALGDIEALLGGI